MKNFYLQSKILLVITFIFTMNLFAQPDKGEFEKWGTIGVGKLVTRISNTNVIASGRYNYPEMAIFPALEFPYNPDPNGRHVYYGSNVSFHIGGFCLDRGPSWDQNPNDVESPMVESGDREHYTFYKGFHYDGHPDYINSSATVDLPRSDDPSTWPDAGWPSHLPVSDPVLDRFYPNHITAYSAGLASPIPISLDTSYGFPGAGPNRYSLPGKYYPGQIVADQEIYTVSYARNRTDDQANGHLMVYTTLRGMSWKEELAEDVLYWIYTVTNIGTEPITKSYMGLYSNLDFPWATFKGYNTYSESESWAFDTYDVDTVSGKEYKIGYGWDGDGNVEGANSGAIPYSPAILIDQTPLDNVSLSGVIFLQTPNDTTGEEAGVTSWDAFGHAMSGSSKGIGNTVEKFYWYNIFNSDNGGRGTDSDDLDGDRIDDWTWENPFPVGDELSYDNGKKSSMSMNTGGFTIQPGETDTLVIATVMGENRSDLFNNAKIARQIYYSGWLVPKSPVTPNLDPVSSDRKVIIRWGNISENDSINALLGMANFEGYKIYKSSNGGKTWGNLPITDANGTVVDYVPVKQNDLENGITGPSPIRPFFNRGSDTGLNDLLSDSIYTREIFLKDLNKYVIDTVKYEYVDEDVINGFTYNYAVVAYSAGAEEIGEGLPPLQNSKTAGPNVFAATPRSSISLTSEELEKVKVVPNPYVVINVQETNITSRMIKFTHLPESCKIQIFNSSGELLETLYHDSMSSEEEWNLRTSENREVAPGLFFYHLESTLGNKIGKFVIIK